MSSSEYVVTDAMVEAACSRFVSESDQIWSAEVWPNGPDDDGSRGDGGHVRLLSENAQHEVRMAMRAALSEALAAASPSTPRLGGVVGIDWSTGPDITAYAAIDHGKVRPATLEEIEEIKRYSASPTSGENGVREALEKGRDLAEQMPDVLRLHGLNIFADHLIEFVNAADRALSASPAGGDSSRDHDQSTTSGHGSLPMPLQDRLYPIVVIQDRYTGAYSGGQWIAVAEADARFSDAEPRTRFDVLMEEGPSGGDTEAMEFWVNPPPWIAVGQSPDEAIRVLLEGN